MNIQEQRQHKKIKRDNVSTYVFVEIDYNKKYEP